MSRSWKLRGYTVERLLGRGATGEVWRAHITATGDPVALKRLVVADPDQARRAHAEAAMLAVLDHPNLVRLHALVPDDDVSVLVLDLADGGSLADLLAARGRLTPGEVITALAPIAAALAYVHAQGVIHGDVSPANVLFTGGGVPLLADLGVARLTGDDSDAESTPAYVDPSVALGFVPGPASDVFMLGAVALHALTGVPVWTSPTTQGALAQARAGELGSVAPCLAEAGVAKEMAAIVVRALALEPGRRCTAADFALELRHSGRPIAVELSAGRARPDPGLPVDPEPPGHGQTTPRAWAAPPTCDRAALREPDRVAPGETDRAASGWPAHPAAVAPGRASAAFVSRVTAARTNRRSSARGPLDRTNRRSSARGLLDRTNRRSSAREQHAPRHAAAPLLAAGRAARLADPSASIAQPAGPAAVRSAVTGPGNAHSVHLGPSFGKDEYGRDRTVGRPPPTTAVQRARPDLPPPPRRPFEGHRRWWLAGIAASVLLGLGGAGVAWSRDGSAEPGRRTAAVPPAPSTPAATSDPAPPAHSSASAASVMPASMAPGPGSRQDWAESLRALDALRSKAFAVRDVALLRQVYVPGPLLEADTALLLRMVPAGCGLIGVRTEYVDVEVQAGSGAARVHTRATLTSSILRCPGHADRNADGVGPSAVSLRLVSTGVGPRIAEQQVG